MTHDTDKQTVENGGDDDRDDAGRFAEGNPGGPGRPKGEPNKIGADLKADLWQAYQRRGGAAWLEKLPDKDFIGLLTRLLPREPVWKPEGPVPPAPTVQADILSALTRSLDLMEAAIPKGADCVTVPMGLPMVDGEVVDE